MKTMTLIAGLAATALSVTPILAHSDVENPTVKARMMAMTDISDATKTLGLMARGRTDFDDATAKAAIMVLIDRSEAIPALFELPEDDPKSEAEPAIWENFDDFVARAANLEEAARAALTSVNSQQTLGAAMQQIGPTCRSCHGPYRE